MKRSILTACVVAVAQLGCQNHDVVSSPPSGVARAQPTPVVTRIPTEVSGLAKSEPRVPVKQPEEPLGLEHEPHGRMDHLARAKDLSSEGDVEGAFMETRRAVYDDPNDQDALTQLAQLGLATKNRSIAARAYHELSVLNPDDAMPCIQEARVWVAMGDVDGAKKAGERALQRDDQNPEVFQVLGRAELSKGGSLQSAIDNLEQAVELAPDHGYALNNLGLAYLRANRNAEAVDVLEKARDLLPNVAYVANNLGIALERMGRSDDAKSAYERAMGLSPKYVKARINSDRISRVAAAAVQEELDALSDENAPDSQQTDGQASETHEAAAPSESASK